MCVAKICSFLKKISFRYDILVNFSFYYILMIFYFSASICFSILNSLVNWCPCWSWLVDHCSCALLFPAKSFKNQQTLVKNSVVGNNSNKRYTDYSTIFNICLSYLSENNECVNSTLNRSISEYLTIHV